MDSVKDLTQLTDLFSGCMFVQIRKQETGTAMSQGHNKDTLVIYYSDEDRCWVAHSLHTDQIGMGERIIDALADALTAIEQVRKVAREDPSVNMWCEAPPEIKALANDAKVLPRELYEIAYKMAHGMWPAEIDMKAESDTRSRFSTELTELEEAV